MERFLALILMCLVSLSLMAGTVAHAAEPIGCLDSDVAAGLGHADGDRDHQIGEPVKDGFATQVHLRTAPPFLPNAKGRVSNSTDPAHRPPKA